MATTAIFARRSRHWGCTYVAGILSNTTVWPPGTNRCRPRMVGPRTTGQAAAAGRRALARLGQGTRVRLAQTRLAHDRMARRHCQTASRFARVRVRVARRDFKRSESRPEEWLLIEWPEGEKEPTKYWLSTLPEDIAFSRMVYFAKLRWRIERDYQDLKQEVGLGHFEGRGWRGFHHHATLCIAAYGFLISERETIPPSGTRSAWRFTEPAVPAVTNPEAPPLRPERHIPNSIATMRARLVNAIARSLPRCPCCRAPRTITSHRRRSVLTQ